MLYYADVEHMTSSNRHNSDDVVVTVRSEQLGEKILEKHQSIASGKLEYVVIEDITIAGAMNKVRLPRD